jgi:hypothetical protein
MSAETSEMLLECCCPTWWFPRIYYSLIFSYPGTLFMYRHQSAGCSVAKFTLKHKRKLEDGFIPWRGGASADVVLAGAWLYYSALMAWGNEHVILTVHSTCTFPQPPKHVSQVRSSLKLRFRHYTVVPRYTSLIRSRSLDLYQTGRIPNEFFP